jgi:Tlde1 domain
VTPPNVYAVSFREKPFHGVRALRMKPVGGGNMYGRDGILAHSYLLGAEGASNGCISVRDYDKFVQAFEDGKFNQIIVLRSADEPVPSQVAGAQAEGT